MQKSVRMLNRLTHVMVQILGAAALALISSDAYASTTVVYVDDSAAPGGDGSEASPVQTVQDGIALLDKKGGVVAIHPGTYLGPVVVDRDDVILWGLADPVYDAEGLLAGFTSDDPDDEEVVITINGKLEDPATGLPLDLIALRGSDNEVHNIVADLIQIPITPGSAAVSTWAADDDFYEDVVFSHILVRGGAEMAGFSAKTNVVFEYVTTLDPGFAGLWIGANGHAEVCNVHVARKSTNICFAALDESPKDENGPSDLTGVLRDSKLEHANGVIGFFNDGSGLLVIGRKNAVNPDESSTMFLEVTGNVFLDNRRGVAVRPIYGPNAFSTEPTLLSLDFHDNVYIDNHIADAHVNFQNPLWAGANFAANSSVEVVDDDGVFPDPADVDLGPVENGNSYEIIED